MSRAGLTSDSSQIASVKRAPLVFGLKALAGCHAQASSTDLPPAKAYSAARSFLMISLGMRRVHFMRAASAYEPELS